MSVATLTSLSINFSAFNASVPPTTGTDRTSRTEGQQEDEKPRFRENTLVSAMMAAFQALGIGQSAATTTTTGSTTPPTSGASTVPATDAAGGTKGTTGTTGTTGTAPASASAPDTLEKAVNEFAHALSVALRRQGGGGHSEGQHDGEHTHDHEGHGGGGYNGLVQRLEQLAQSLGGTTPTSPGSTPPASGATPSTTGSPSDQSGAAPVSTSGTSAPSTDPAQPTLSRPLARLLTAFTNVLNFLQPAAATSTPANSAPATTTPAAPADTPATSASVTDKLRLFLTTLAQSLNSGAQLSPVGSRVNYSV